MATASASLLESARQSRDLLAPLAQFAGCDSPQDSSITPAAALHIYHACLRRLRIPQRFPQTDWSIADKWIAKDLFRRGTPLADVRAILKLGSPLFPRRHGDPDDYLRRTLARAARELQAWPFSAGCPRTVALSARTHHNFSSPPAPAV
jgi:hypothetical protein